MQPDWWYKRACIYSLDVETFQDSNGDGIGDFPGLTSRLDYLAGLGITCVWLLPFYPSPNRDNGYDITDYYGVDARLGTLGDFVEFIHAAQERGIRVLIDLVVNHTSDQHPWFQAARSNPDSPYRDYYIWSKEKPADADQGMVFPGVQESTWTYDTEAQLFYFHRFYKYQPDLNISNPAVRAEIMRIMGFWLELGVSGFRVDAAPFLIEMKGTDGQQGDMYEYLGEFDDFLTWRRGDAIMLAEANVPFDKIDQYFGEGHRMTMIFNFLLNQNIFLALARQSAQPIIDCMQATPGIPKSCQWANFLRNHDELDLGRLSEKDRQFVFEQFGPKETMQIYNRGIRRRLPPMLAGDQRRLRLAYSLMWTLPGTPVLRYGEEIGMGDDLSLDQRNSVRTPMQWTDTKNAGFSDAPRDGLVRPVIDAGPYSYANEVNVADQRRDPDSLFNWMERAIRARKECPEFGRGGCAIIDTGHPAVFAHACTWNSRTVVAVHNLADKDCTITLDLSDYNARQLNDLLGDKQYRKLEHNSTTLELEGYGYRWFRLDDHPHSAPSHNQ